MLVTMKEYWVKIGLKPLCVLSDLNEGAGVCTNLVTLTPVVWSMQLFRKG